MKEHPRCPDWFLEEDKRMGFFYGQWYTLLPSGGKFYGNPESKATVTTIDDKEKE